MNTCKMHCSSLFLVNAGLLAILPVWRRSVSCSDFKTWTGLNCQVHSHIWEEPIMIFFWKYHEISWNIHLYRQNIATNCSGDKWCKCMGSSFGWNFYRTNSSFLLRYYHAPTLRIIPLNNWVASGVISYLFLFLHICIYIYMWDNPLGRLTQGY